MKIPPKKTDKGILYVQGVSNENIAWVRDEAKSLGYRAGELLNIIFANLRDSKPSKAKRKKK